MRATGWPPQCFLALQTFVQRHHLQLIHDRVRICTSRCRCHRSCRRSRFSASATQMRGKRSSIISCSNNCASWRSVLCLRTRFVRISAAFPIHNSNCNSRSRRSTDVRVRSLPSPPALPSSVLSARRRTNRDQSKCGLDEMWRPQQPYSQRDNRTR